MDGVSGEQEQKFQSAHQLYLATKKSFRDLDIPPRKLLTRRLQSLSSEPSLDMNYHIMYDQSPKVFSEDQTLFQKFLPNNISNLDDESDPYAYDEFRMYEFKIRKCTRSRSHDWTDCPFAHPGEKARRRCIRRFNYSSEVCPDFRSRGSCLRGDTCEFAHGVFESWLHPSRYRTEACKDGKICQRKICFFAHNPSQLRSVSAAEKRVSAGPCSYCRYYPGIRHTTSPTSILDFDHQTPPPTPPFSAAPPVSGFSPVSRFAGASCKDSMMKGLINHKEIEELMQSMKAIDMNANDQGPKLIKMESFRCNGDRNSFFSYSPLTPQSSSGCGSSRVLPGECNTAVNALSKGKFIVNESSTSGPDLEWVNDLLT